VAERAGPIEDARWHCDIVVIEAVIDKREAVRLCIHQTGPIEKVRRRRNFHRSTVSLHDSQTVSKSPGSDSGIPPPGTRADDRSRRDLLGDERL
jgi:hypothetical protein